VASSRGNFNTVAQKSRILWLNLHFIFPSSLIYPPKYSTVNKKDGKEGINVTDGACNYRFGGPAMRDHWRRVKWNANHILDLKSTNPHIKEEQKAYQDMWASLVNIPVGYAKLCPARAGKVHFTTMVIGSISLVLNTALAIQLIL
jgi:hypothetical protein